MNHSLHQSRSLFFDTNKNFFREEKQHPRETSIKHLTSKDKTEPKTQATGESKQPWFLLISFSDSCHRATCTSQRSQQSQRMSETPICLDMLSYDSIGLRDAAPLMERLSFCAEGSTRFGFRQKPVTLPVSIMQSLIDNIVARFQSNISWAVTEESLLLSMWRTVGNYSKKLLSTQVKLKTKAWN